jgi:hypothetical protein
VAHVDLVGEAHELLDEPLATVIGGVGLTRDDELDGSGGVEQQAAQPRRVVEHQRKALVGGHPAREADGQHLRIERALGPPELGVARAAVDPRIVQPPAPLQNQLRPQGVAQIPDVGVADPLDALPALCLLGQRRADLAPAEFDHLTGDPGRRVHAVGHRGDRDVFVVKSRPQPGEHAAAHRAVQLGDAIGPLGQPHAHDGHVEHRGVSPLVGLGTERQHLLDRHPDLGVVSAEVLADQIAAESVDAGRNWGMGSENGPRPRRLECTIEVQARRLDQLADPF